MKRYKKLWDVFISRENFEIAAAKAVKSKKSKKQTKLFLKNKDELLEKLRSDIIHGGFRTSRYNVFTIYEPKQRLIYELPLYPDHIVHHAIINVLGPIWHKQFINDTYACIPGRGVHLASQRTMEFIKRNKFILQCDIRKFYPSINHDILVDILRRKIADRRLLKLLEQIIYSLPGGKNLPIGNLTSQWMGNVYLGQMDLFIKHVLKCRDYVRYSDDFCLYGNDKQQLMQYAKKIEKFLNTKLDLAFSKCVIRQTSLGVTFIGYRHFRKFILLRHDAVMKIKRRLRSIARRHDRSAFAVSQIASTKGYLQWACTYNLRQKIWNMVHACGGKRITKFIKKRLDFGTKN